jgi:putative FmdB family regulatory protein
MPTYVYRCAKCGEQIEAFQSFADAPLTKHTECGGKLTKVLSAAGIVLKGSGFYKTDNRSGSSKGAPREKQKESASSGSGSSDSGSSGSSGSDSSSGSGSASNGSSKSGDSSSGSGSSGSGSSGSSGSSSGSEAKSA